MSKISKDLDIIANNVAKLRNSLGGLVGNITFSYDEQELVRRIVKSVFPQIESKKDRATARTILSKTEWVDG